MEHTFRLRYTIGMEDETVGSFIRRLRKAAGLTQGELGDAIDFTGRRVSEWESDRAVPSRDAIRALARVFHVSPDDIMRRLDADDAAIIAEEKERRKGHGPERQRAAFVLEDLIAYPDLIENWLRYGEYLLTQRHTARRSE